MTETKEKIRSALWNQQVKLDSDSLKKIIEEKIQRAVEYSAALKKLENKTNSR